MNELCLVDNDVVLKVAAYDLKFATFSSLKRFDEPPAMLGVGRFVVRRKVVKSQRFKHPKKVAAVLESLLEDLQFVEPTEAEIEIAAEFEEAALRLGGAFDVGEAQLFAILVSRRSPALVTGDKRAIEAARTLEIDEAKGRIVCFEQLIAHLLTSVPVEEMRSKVCEEPRTDRALSICFACANLGTAGLQEDEALAGLMSYIRHTRRQSGELLMQDADISSLAS